MDIFLFQGMDTWVFAVYYEERTWFFKVKALMLQYGSTIRSYIRPTLSRPGVLLLVSVAVKFELKTYLKLE